ncbi:hypothetical protein LPJ66_001445, partial [Kickxella alabastrina]
SYMSLLDAEMEKDSEQLKSDGEHCRSALLESLRCLVANDLDGGSLVGLTIVQRSRLAEVVGETMANLVFADRDAAKIVTAVLAVGKSWKDQEDQVN